MAELQQIAVEKQIAVSIRFILAFMTLYANFPIKLSCDNCADCTWKVSAIVDVDVIHEYTNINAT